MSTTAGYVALMPGWPNDPETVADAKAHPEVFAGKAIGEIADYEEGIIRRLDRKPVVIGHSFGGLLTEILAGRGLAAASVGISPAPFRGVPRVLCGSAPRPPRAGSAARLHRRSFDVLLPTGRSGERPSRSEAAYAAGC